MQHFIVNASTGPARFAGLPSLPAVGAPGAASTVGAPGAELAGDVAGRAAECALVERRLGARDPVEFLYRRAHSLLRSLRRHLAVLDARSAA